MKMDYSKVISAASKNDTSAKKNTGKGKGDPKKPHTEKPCDVQTGAVKAFLQKRVDEEKQKAKEAKKKKVALIAARVEADTSKRARAMASRTKDNLKVFEFGGKTECREEKAKKPENQQNTKPELDSVEFGGKRRVARMSNEKILETRRKLEMEKKAEIERKKLMWNDSDSDHGHNLKVDIKCEVMSQRPPTSTSKSSSSKSSSSHRSASSSMHKDKHKQHDKHRDKHKEKKREHKEHRREERKEEKKERSKPKPKAVKRKQGAPPMSFAQILALAQTNKNKPPAEEDDKPAEKPKDKPPRPMTQEQKERIERRKSKEYQHWLKHGGKMPALPSSEQNKRKGRPDPPKAAAVPSPAKQAPKSAERPKIEDAKRKTEQQRPQKNGNPASNDYGIVNENVLSCGKDNPRKRPADDEEEQEEKPLSTWDKIYSKVRKPKPVDKKPRIESEEEEEEYDDDFVDDDDELDDFIDDTEAVDYSSAIRDIFGYDKRKYHNEREEDISDMEANFDQINREEKMSARIGLKEDLEDIKREQEELRMKSLKNLKKKKGRR